MKDSQILSKAYGALIGSALGDAIGLYTGQSRFMYCRDSASRGPATEFMTPEQSLAAYPSASFSLVEPVTDTHQDTHRCKPMLVHIICGVLIRNYL